MRITAAVLALTLVGAAGLQAQDRPHRSEPPSLEELRGISRRGQLLAQYDRAAWDATDAVQARHPVDDRIRNYIPRREGDTWTVAFGRMNTAQDTFFVAYEARLVRGDSAFRVSEIEPARPDTGYFLRAARAIDVGMHQFRSTEARPYNVAAIPADSARWWVYLYPAQTQRGVWPLGADERFLVSADGRRILERRRMHQGIVEYRMPPNPPGRLEAFTHTAVLDDVPEDTDVFTVLSRTPRAPEIVVTDAFVYRVNVDGSIAYLGRRDDVLGKGPSS